LKVLIRGRLPNIQEITNHLTDNLGKNKGTVYKFIPQPRREIFNNKVFNSQLNAINFDVNVLHEEIIEQFALSSRRLNYADLYHRAHSHELQKLESLLTSILFTFENADFYFLGAFENFSDYSKTDLEKSDPDIINLTEKAIMLPYGGTNTQRIGTSHMHNKASWPVTVLFPAERGVIERKQVVGTSFGEIFSDVVNGWMYEVTTSEQSDTAIQFKFPLAGLANDEAEVQVNRFELVPLSTTPQRALVEFSTDDVNYKTPEGYEEGILMKDQKITYALDFITELVQFVRITLLKTEPDEDLSLNSVGKRFVYRFGLKGFSALTTGRKERARYQSKPFTFSGEEEKISRVALKADAATPAGTLVDFSIALADHSGSPVTGFLPIKPIGGDAKPGAAETIVFSTAESHATRFEARSGEFSLRDTLRGHSYYKYTVPVLPEPIFGTASMTRGYRVWYRDAGVALTRTEVRDNYISFAKADIEHLYTTTTEVPIHRSFTEKGVKKTVVTTSKDIYYTQGIHDLIPNFDQQKSGSDMAPTYAIYKVEYISDTPIRTDKVATTGLTRIQLPRDNFVLQGTDAPVVRLFTNNVATTTYVPGRDYIFETETIGGVPKPTGFLNIVPTSQGGQIFRDNASPTLQVRTTIQSDVTYKVVGVVGNTVTLSPMTATSGDSFKITYRYVPLSPNSIEKASIRVKDNISNSRNVTFFAEGVDYVLDPVTGSIQRLPNGSIGDKGSVFVDFLFRNADRQIETFLTWCLVQNPDGARIKFDLDPTTRRNVLVAEDSIGEQFLVNTPTGLIDLTKADQSPLLGPGWVQFIVRSKNPDGNQQNNGKGNLIDQVIQLRDVNKKRVFKENGPYFSTVLALRDPMAQITLNHLRVNTLPSNHSFFALDTTKKDTPLLVLNFNPGDPKELYLKIPRDETATDPRPESYFEVFSLTWQSKTPRADEGTSVIVRCDLTREDGIDGGITPKVFNYFLKASEL
jgi:hypothetical protein